MVNKFAQLGAIDIIELMKFLPHRYPFLLVDRIIDIKGDESAIGIKNVTLNEPHFMGHFPGMPVMPGVLILEGMAQTAGAVCAIHNGFDKHDPAYLMSIDKARFRKPVVPGDRLEFHVHKLRNRSDIWKFRCQAKVENCVVSEADICAIIMREQKGKNESR
ncbi:3-hydroxyacyl-ACP dehydratase [Candidatus Liberibacter solanacearum]|uniref:3-hydroxyacyl-[acyl-carrier-protein] dehydratase FabZ n=1 Tax=Candidatus Liberibacter solanacearum TaxID=556287 RepID=A0A094Z2S0_9HYPH|nr:3-hydroxyacyl-ACP dehydratase FabZ [Candidatus Liberibacter solanacearum]KGB27952.1 3-hydroxyacyl-ACP dehydratase [Candidatus Liberibacter solanacearum]KJZ80949.1 3-hydroxyacyl-ACP dehydratase [Candidatus Liberibacter solanacearum]KJZ82111.1 (3R)-hydroxymyristoyl-[acyl carrier protein] dehydratase [Candidatus Liberibacter solanacearum]KQC49477.1 3-hydroxyacyl-ACP dehydratase [Candidatus Liberibacter solanacearum]